MNREEAIYFANCLKNNYTIDLNDMETFCDMAIKALAQAPTTKNNLGVEEVTALAEWTEKLTKECEEAYNKGYEAGRKELEPITSKDKFIYALTACGCLLKDGKTWYEHDELIKCFEDMGLFEQEPTTKNDLRVDCISRADALALYCDKCPLYNCTSKCASYRAVEKMPSVTPPQEPIWVPVSERLPRIHNYMQEYIVTIKGDFIRTAFFTETNGRSWWSIDNVIAWMPLPQAYSEVEK